jgi:hypothetical protein
MKRYLVAASLLFSIGFAASPAMAAEAESVFATPLGAKMLDADSFAQWVDGAESRLEVSDGPRHLVWTRDSAPQWDGVRFGESKQPGVRHLRVGWTKPLEIGAVLVRGGGQLSVLRPEAAYPGNLGDDAQWIPAVRIKGRQVGGAEVQYEEYAIWLLPPRTATRALRLTHTAEATEKTYNGWCGGLFVLGPRVVNVAPQAIASASSRTEAADRINNETNDGMWNAWDNEKQGAEQVISAEHPERVVLVWPEPVRLCGLCALWAGFGAAEVQTYTGPADRHPRQAEESDWQTIKGFDKIDNQYPRSLGVNWMDFGRTITTRAVRLCMTQATREGHPHLVGKTNSGKRVWLGELLALAPLGDAEPQTALLPEPATNAPGHPPIPIRFTLPEAGLVTLVIDDATGRRVRNLLSETPFPAGQNTAWWDGRDDLGRDTEAARHGIYHVPGQFVTPGEYRVRGLWRKPIDLRYEFSIYNGGSPAWMTADNTGGWLTNHTPPSSVLFVPAARNPAGQPLVYIGSYVSEGGHGLAWVDLDGKKVGGRGWVGGAWTAAPYLAFDAGAKAIADTYAYVGSAWEKELRLTALTAKGDRSLVKYAFPSKEASVMKGLAVHDGILACSLPTLNRLLLIDIAAGTILGEPAIDDPRGLAFDAQGRLLVVVGKQLHRYEVSLKSNSAGSSEVGWVERSEPHQTNTPSSGGARSTRPTLRLSPPQVLVASGLDDPLHVTLDSQGNVYVSDCGKSHQVKVFSSAGQPLRTIGKPGAPKAGPYDPLHMNNPNGLAIDANDHLWVAEADFQPKRVSVWTLDGKLLKAFYGPSEYGGGGALDPQDKTKFYYHGMEFALDWEHGADQLARVFYRPGPGDLVLPSGFGTGGQPETPLYRQGQRYFTNCYNSNPTNGTGVAVVFLDRNGTAVPVAAMGTANHWDLLKTDAFKPRWPPEIDLKGDPWRNQTMFAWSDLNGDGQVQPEEVTFRKVASGGVTVMPDLAMLVSRVGENAMRYVPRRFTDHGVPVYDLDSGEVLVSGAQPPTSSGGDQVLVTPDGWSVFSIAPKPFAPQSLGGAFRGTPRWSYPSPWPGLHASHESPSPDRPGELIGTTRLLGGIVTPRSGDAGPLWAINGNQGNMYLFTVDGLFVATLFHDIRLGRPWSMPIARRGMLLNDLTCHDENFWPSIAQTAGDIYMVDGANTSLVKVENLETIRRLPDAPLQVRQSDLHEAEAYLLRSEMARQKTQGQEIFKVAMRSEAPTVDGRLDDWRGAQWITVDRRGVAAYFDSKSKPYDITAAIAVAGDRLYAAFRTNEPNLLQNSGELPIAPFKTGGALDLMIGTNPKADPKRTQPVEGDLRLLVTLVKNKPLALLYRPVVPGTREPVPFSSPWRTITIDRVENVSDRVQLAGADGNYELSVPLAVLGLRPQPGQTLRGDIGLLRGNGFQTLHRVYWSNKATGLTSDVPSEAMLTPQLWGTWLFVRP